MTTPPDHLEDAREAVERVRLYAEERADCYDIGRASILLKTTLPLMRAMLAQCENMMDYHYDGALDMTDVPSFIPDQCYDLCSEIIRVANEITGSEE